MTDYYKKSKIIDSAFAYQNIAIAAKDSLFSKEKQREIQNLSYEETMRQQQILAAKQEAQTQLKFNALLGGIATLLIWVCQLGPIPGLFFRKTIFHLTRFIKKS